MKSLLWALVAGAVALVPVVAEAHGPTRQKIEVTREIDAPADKVWAVVSNFQDLSWIPGVKSVEGSGSEVGATRTITLENGEKLVEKMDKFDAAKMMFMYRAEADNIKFLPVTNYSSRITVKDAGGKSTVTWWGAFYRGYPNNDPPPELSDEAAVKAVTDLYNAGLDGLKKKVEGGS
ncbi:SRPBCC family protein [Chthonobacter albigriseus]|uniref:SRPBCC family protein n=1 Tax=Chthonobacter albigriseus TaxID=1683161 RepID=UPI0015EECC17|nr:SRPBCC family protein [Chthonobacter albigriseus]